MAVRCGWDLEMAVRCGWDLEMAGRCGRDLEMAVRTELGSRSGRRSARCFGGCCRSDQGGQLGPRGGEVEKRRGGTRRRDEPVAGCERSGPDEQDRAVEMNGRGEFVGAAELDGTYVRSGRRRAHSTAKRSRTAPKGVERAAKGENGDGRWSREAWG